MNKLDSAPLAPLLKRDSKELIITLLGERGAMTAKEAHQLVVEECNANITYQAVHKALGQLAKDGVVESVGKGYALREDWLRNIKSYSERLLAARSGAPQPILRELEKTGNVNLHFNQLLEFGHWVVRFHANLVNSNPSKEPQVFHMRHIWPANLKVDADYEYLTAMFSKPTYTLVRGNTFMDRVLKEIPEKLGCKVKLGADVAATCDTVASYDYVYNVYFSRELRDALDREYKKVPKGEPVSFKGLFDIAHDRKYSLRVVLTKSPEVAQQLREETLEQFR